VDDFVPFYHVPLRPYYLQLQLADAAELPKELYLDMKEVHWIEAKGLGDRVASIAPDRGMEDLLGLVRDRELEKEKQRRRAAGAAGARADKRLYQLYFDRF
jgi:hypothetical protein